MKGETSAYEAITYPHQMTPNIQRKVKMSSKFSFTSTSKLANTSIRIESLEISSPSQKSRSKHFKSANATPRSSRKKNNRTTVRSQKKNRIWLYKRQVEVEVNKLEGNNIFCQEKAIRKRELSKLLFSSPDSLVSDEAVDEVIGRL